MRISSEARVQLRPNDFKQIWSVDSDTASQHDTLRDHCHSEIMAQGRNDLCHIVPDIVTVWDVRCGLAAAGLQCRPANEAFDAALVKAAASRPARLRRGDDHMTGLGMSEAEHRSAINNGGHADPGSDRDIAPGSQIACRAPDAFGEGRAVDIRIDQEWNVPE